MIVTLASLLCSKSSEIWKYAPLSREKFVNQVEMKWLEWSLKIIVHFFKWWALWEVFAKNRARNGIWSRVVSLGLVSPENSEILLAPLQFDTTNFI